MVCSARHDACKVAEHANIQCVFAVTIQSTQHSCAASPVSRWRELPCLRSGSSVLAAPAPVSVSVLQHMSITAGPLASVVQGSSAVLSVSEKLYARSMAKVVVPACSTLQARQVFFFLTTPMCCIDKPFVLHACRLCKQHCCVQQLTGETRGSRSGTVYCSLLFSQLMHSMQLYRTCCARVRDDPCSC
jgi:hypothetical protein